MMSKVSVDRFLSGTVEDIKMSTVARIVRVLVNGSWGQYPCATGDLSEHETVYIDNPEIVRKAEESSAECKRLQTILDSMNQEHRADIAAAHTEDQRKIDFLKEQIKFQEDQLVAKDKLLDERRDFLVRKDRAIVTLSILFAIAMLIIIFALIVDRLNYDLGFFWRMASNFRTAWGLNGINI